MKILLIYYTGTFNTRYICNMVKNKFLEQSHQVDVFEWSYDGPQTISMEGYDIIGFGYPIYGFNIPSMFIKFLKKQKYPSQARYFVFKNSIAWAKLSNFVSELSKKFLYRKCNLLLSEFI